MYNIQVHVPYEKQQYIMIMMHTPKQLCQNPQIIPVESFDCFDVSTTVFDSDCACCYLSAVHFALTVCFPQFQSRTMLMATRILPMTVFPVRNFKLHIPGTS